MLARQRSISRLRVLPLIIILILSAFRVVCGMEPLERLHTGASTLDKLLGPYHELGQFLTVGGVLKLAASVGEQPVVVLQVFLICWRQWLWQSVCCAGLLSRQPAALLIARIVLGCLPLQFSIFVPPPAWPWPPPPPRAGAFPLASRSRFLAPAEGQLLLLGQRRSKP